MSIPKGRAVETLAAAIAVDFGVSTSAISAIKRGLRWRS